MNDFDDDDPDDDDLDMTGETSPTGRLYVYFKRPRCPQCGTTRLAGNGTRANGDGTSTRYAACRQCSAKLLLVSE